MKKMYAATERFEDGYETFFNYFPTVGAAQKMFDGEKADCASRGVNIEMILEEIPLPAKLEVFDRYEVGSVYTKDDRRLLSLFSDSWKWDVFANANVIDFWYDEREHWDINHSHVVIDVNYDEAKQMINDYLEAEKEAKRHSYDKYLSSPFAKGWLNKMQYTERVDEYGNKFLFIAIKCGYKKLSDKSFQKLCNAICMRAYGDRLRMTMWIGGKVNWTMFYQRPDHVNGHETYFCGVVGQDDFGPEDWDKDHSEYSFKNADRY